MKNPLLQAIAEQIRDGKTKSVECQFHEDSKTWSVSNGQIASGRYADIEEAVLEFLIFKFSFDL